MQGLSGAARSVFAVSSARALGSILALIIGILSAAYFGTSTEKDSYLIAEMIPRLLTIVLLGGVYTSLIVTLADIGRARGIVGQVAFVRKTLWRLTLILLACVLIVYLGAQGIIRFIAPGFDPSQVRLSASLLQIAIFTSIGTVYFAVIRSLFETRGRFAISSYINLLSGLVAMLTLILLVKRLGIYALAVGSLLGIVIACCLLGGLAFATLKDAPDFTPSGADPSADRHRRFWADFLPMTVAVNFGQVNLLIDNAFSSLLPVGSITLLGFAFVMVSNAEMVTTRSLAQVSFARMASAVAEGGNALADTFRTSLRYMLLITIPMSVGAIVFGAPLARLFFERGEFGPAATRSVATLLACYSLEMIFMGYLALFARVLFARKRPMVASLAAVSIIIANALLNYLLMKPFGVYGIALSTTCVTILHAWLLAPYVRKEIGPIHSRADLTFLGKILSSALIMGIVVWLWAQLCEAVGDVQFDLWRSIEVLIGLALGGAVYALLLHWWRIDEARVLMRGLLKFRSESPTSS